MQADVQGFVHRGQTSRRTGVHQVFGDFGLAVDHDLFAAGKLLQINTVAAAIKAQRKAAMHQAFRVHACAHASVIEQVSRALLKHAGADAGLHVLLAALLDDDGVDAGFVEQLPQ